MLIYLYVKRHLKTGLKYFGVTTNPNPTQYLGSGVRWRNHLKKHGRQIETTNLWTFADQQTCSEFAAAFSREHNIVESEEWANLIDETGVTDGGFDKDVSSGLYDRLVEKHGIHPVQTTEVNNRRRSTVLAQIAAGIHNSQNPEILQKRRQSTLTHLAAGTHNTQNADINRHRSEVTTERIKAGRHQSQIEYTCPICNKTGRSSFFTRKHFGNCVDIQQTHANNPNLETV